MEVSDLLNEMVSIKEFIKEVLPDADIKLQNVPEKPTPNTLVIRFQNDNREVETAFHVVAEREYQIICYGDKAPEVLTKMDGLSRKFLYGRTIIPIKNSLRYIRVAGFSFGRIFKTEQDNLEACIGVLNTEIREARDQQTYDKIMQVSARFK